MTVGVSALKRREHAPSPPPACVSILPLFFLNFCLSRNVAACSRPGLYSRSAGGADRVFDNPSCRCVCCSILSTDFTAVPPSLCFLRWCPPDGNITIMYVHRRRSSYTLHFFLRNNFRLTCCYIQVNVFNTCCQIHDDGMPPKILICVTHPLIPHK